VQSGDLEENKVKNALAPMDSNRSSREMRCGLNWHLLLSLCLDSSSVCVQSLSLRWANTRANTGLGVYRSCTVVIMSEQ